MYVEKAVESFCGGEGGRQRRLNSTLHYFGLFELLQLFTFN